MDRLVPGRRYATSRICINIPQADRFEVEMIDDDVKDGGHKLMYRSVSIRAQPFFSFPIVGSNNT